MTSVVPNEFIGATSYAPVQQVAEMVFYANVTLNNNFSGVQSEPLVISGIPINLRRLPDNVDAYFAVKWIIISTRKSPSFADKHRSPAFQSFNQSVPNNASPQTFTYLFNTGNPTFFNRIQLFNIPNLGTFQIDFVQARPHGAANYFDTLTQYLGNASSVVNGIGPATLLTQFFDPFDGLFNISSANVGFDVEIAITNTSGVTQNISGYFWGSTYAYDWLQMLVQYQDWRGRVYNVGVFDDRAVSVPYQVGQRVPTPLEDPNQTNFGNLLFTNNGFNSFFNTSYTYDIELAGSIEFIPKGSPLAAY